MPVYTVVGDPHAKPDNLDKLGELFDVIENLGNDCIILGDLLDTKELVRGKCLNFYLNRIGRSKLHFTIIVGNHDYFNLACEDHSLQALRHLSNVTLINDPHCIFSEKSDYRLGFIPYIHDSEKLKQALQLLKHSDVIFCHADIKGFDYGNGLLSQAGLDSSELKDYPTIISGHYHKYQAKENITYLGTPFSHSFGESNQTKYIGLYSTEDHNLRLLETSFPKHITYYVNCSQTREHPLIGTTDYVRVVLSGKQEDIASFPRENGIKYIEKPDSDRISTEIAEDQTPEIQFINWAINVKDYDEAYITLGLDILKDV
jgi:hypothetical protein